MMYWQAITNKPTAGGTRAALVGNHDHASAEPITPAICFDAANPKRRPRAGFVCVSIRITARFRAIIASMTVSQLPRLSLERLVAVFTNQKNGRNPLVIIRATTDRWLRITFGRLALGVHSYNHITPSTVPRTILALALIDFALSQFDARSTHRTKNRDSIDWLAHIRFLLSYIIPQLGGSGTVGRVAMRLQRSAVLCELNADYITEHIDKRTDGVQVELFV